MAIYQAKANPVRTCNAEPYEWNGERRYTIRFGDAEYDLDAETFDEMWEPLNGGVQWR